MPSAPPTAESPSPLHWVAWSALLFIALTRALVPFEPFPYWDMDPATVYVPMTGVGPTGSLILDALAMFACALALFAETHVGRPILKLPCTLAAIGAVPVFVHALSGPNAPSVSIDNARIGLDWLAAIATGLAFVHIARTPHLARLTFIILAGFIALLAAKGAAQVFVEHPATVADYNANRAAILASHGWESGSPMALGFERRLNQAEATGWFGLSNVYASFAAAGAILLIALTASAWRAVRAKRLPDGIAGIVTLGLLAALGAVVMAGSKAGYVALILGAALLGLSAVIRAAPGMSPLKRLGEPGTTPRLGPALAMSIIAAALIAVAARGLIGESLGERSILFRSFYIRGAARIIASDPLLGVGPAGFKDAYQIAKPAIAPETVDSPHSILFDFAATLGIGGLAWCALFLLWTAWAGRTLLEAPTDANAPPARASFRPVVYLILAVTIAGAWLPTIVAAAVEHGPIARWLQIPIATPDWALVLLLGAIAWIAVSISAAAVLATGAPWRPAAAAAALAIAAHAQIEMTPIQPGSCTLFMLFIALAAARPARVADAANTRDWPIALLPTAAALGTLALAVPIAQWESGLARAALAFRPVAELRPRIDAIDSVGAASPDDPAIDTLSALLGAPRATGLADIAAQFRELTIRAIDSATADLPTSPVHDTTMQVQSRIQLLRAALHHQADPAIPVFGLAGESELIAEKAAATFRTSSGAWAWLGAVRAARSDLENDPDRLARAIEAWERAAALDPHGLSLPIHLYEACTKLGRESDARSWARKALQIDENLRLDPLLRLTDKQRAQARALAGEP